VQTCRSDPTCVQFLDCIVACEKQGNNALSCSLSNACKQYASQGFFFAFFQACGTQCSVD
jgi:hypothetical protein